MKTTKTFSIESGVYEIFDNICKEKSLNKSELIEDGVKKIILDKYNVDYNSKWFYIGVQKVSDNFQNAKEILNKIIETVNNKDLSFVADFKDIKYDAIESILKNIDSTQYVTIKEILFDGDLLTYKLDNGVIINVKDFHKNYEKCISSDDLFKDYYKNYDNVIQNIKSTEYENFYNDGIKINKIPGKVYDIKYTKVVTFDQIYENDILIEEPILNVGTIYKFDFNDVISFNITYYGKDEEGKYNFSCNIIEDIYKLTKDIDIKIKYQDFYQNDENVDKYYKLKGSNLKFLSKDEIKKFFN
jgi:hypothetical protein